MSPTKLCFRVGRIEVLGKAYPVRSKFHILHIRKMWALNEGNFGFTVARKYVILKSVNRFWHGKLNKQIPWRSDI
jgi:hypothetical protein